jgi:hypothetical protein
VSFVTFLFSILRNRLHGFIACVLLLLFFAIPDVFAYSYIILYDYSNMIFFFCGFYFLTQHLIHKRDAELAFSILLFGLATYIRVETLILAGMVMLMPVFCYFREKMPWGKIAFRAALFMSGPIFFYVLCMNIFIANIVPVHLDTSTQMNQNLADISPFFTRLSGINSELIFGEKGKLVYGQFFYFFMGILAIDLVFIRKFNLEARMALYGIAVIYLGLAFLGYFLPLFDLVNTTKRGFFKVVPLIIFYMANSGILMKISDYLKKKESGIKEVPVPVAAIPKQRVKAKK